MSVARFTASGCRIGLPRRTKATLTIDRDTGMVTVRANRKRKTYTMHICEVVELIACAVCRAEAIEKRKSKKGK